jgi:hypothetical protein
MESPYNPANLTSIREQKNAEAKKDYISERIKQLTAYGENINPYDLGHMARITEIKDEAKRMYSK